RQGWLATADGFFTREFHLAYDFTNAERGPDAHEVLVRFNYPLSRRFWAGIEVPFYQRLSNGADNFGDITLSTLFMLAETRDLSLNAGVAWRLPTGSTRLGNNQFVPTPQVNFFTDIGNGFSFRGRVGYAIADRGTDAVVVNATIGQTITPHNRAPFGDLTWYLAANWNEPVNRSAPTFVSITPGLRTHLGGNLFLLGGIEFPVTPARDSFRERLIIQIVQGF
ncbi:MAG: transporter, partial [Sphingomonas sp.]|nr:transporter [Sphingomonas sp.]